MICLLVPLVLLFTRSSSKAAMWTKPLNSTLFGSTPQLYRWSAEKERFVFNWTGFFVVLDFTSQFHRDCTPGFLCINLGENQELHKEDENEVEDKMAEFFQPAASILPQRAGRDSDEFVCETHTVLLRGRCWVLCDSIKLWPCGQPLLKMRAPESVRNTWRHAGWNTSGRVSKVEIYILQEVLGPSGLRRPPSLLIVCLLVASVLAILLTSSFGLFGHSSRFIDATMIG